MGQKKPVTIIAFSGRSLAEACLAAGYRPTVFDHFGDRDTLAAAREHVPFSFASSDSCLVDQLRPHKNLLQSGAPILLGGGCENRPSLLAYLESLGESPMRPDQLEMLRSPSLWQTAATAAGCHFPPTIRGPHTTSPPATSPPATSPPATSPPANQAKAPAQWLQKHEQGSGGMHITRASQPPAQLPPGVYLQREIAGRQLGACCVVSPRQASQLIGVTESLGPRDWPAPGEFIYRGSLGPIQLFSHHRAKILKLAETLREQTGICGWLQMDFILDKADRLWLLEVNPRWTAGMEVLVQSGHSNPVEPHLAALAGQPIQSASPAEPRSQYGKAVYYARSDLQLTAELLAHFSHLSTDHYGDIPSAGMLGEVIPWGHPVVSVKAQLPAASQRQHVLAALHHRAAKLFGQ